MSKSEHTETKTPDPHFRSEIISILYTSILGRPADSDGLKGYIRRTANDNLVTMVRRVADGLLSSREFYTRFSEENGRKSIAKEIRILFPHAISLGTHCQTSSILKKYGLKDFSAPFDWLFSSPGMVNHCLEDNFSCLMDPGHYAPIARPNQAQHAYYLEHFGVDSVFAHFDPRLEEKHSYLGRCVNRFITLLDSGAPILLVMVARPNLSIESVIENLSYTLQRWPNAYLVAVQLLDHSGSGAITSSRLVRNTDHYRLYEFQPISKELGVGWPDPDDDARFLRLILDGARAFKKASQTG